MGTYLTLHINITFKESTPACVQDFFAKGIQHKAIPSFLYEMGLNFTNKINLSTPDMLITEFGAKTYTNDKPNTRLRLQLMQEFDLDAYILSVYPFITFVAAYAEDDCIAGYIKDEMQQYDAFAIKDGIVHWQQNQQIEIDESKKLDFYELVALATKIRNLNSNDEEMENCKFIFKKNTSEKNLNLLLNEPHADIETVIEMGLK